MSNRKHLFRFAVVGFAAFLIDWVCFTAFMRLCENFPLARALSYLCAVTSTWYLNRIWTFSNKSTALLQQWFKFFTASLVGGSMNYLGSIGLAQLIPQIFLAFPVLALAAGSLFGMVANFLLSKRYVFRS